jgi:hypothetical protein
VSFGILALVGIAGWVGYQTVTARSTLETELREKNALVEKLHQDVAEKERRIQELDLANRLLKQDHRLAKITVLKQWDSKETQHRMTDILFVDIDDDGHQLDQPRKFTIEGDLLYIDSWVIKYLDKYIEAGDPLRGTSVCLLKRLWGEFQEPSDGFPLDPAGSRPVAYDRGSQMPDFEREVWEHFWDYANNPLKAREAGIRAAHGIAPSIKLQPDKSYIFELRSTGDPTIKPVEEAEKDRQAL